MKHLLLGMLCLFVICNRLTAHPYPVTDLSPVDRLAHNVPAYAYESIESLMVYGKANTKTSLETVRFYFVWLAENIHYDTLESKALKPHTDKQEPDSVFRYRKGICRGYADLMALLCNKAGIPARTVTGYCKTTEGELDSVKFHAWNAVKIDKQWHLFDVTWASNHFEKDKVLDDYFNYNFQQNSTSFIKRHYPFDPVFQLSKNAVVKASFFFSDSMTDTSKDEQEYETSLSCDFNKILDDETVLSPLDQDIKSYERAVAFIPEERRLYDVLSYFQSEKAHIYFNQGSSLLDKFRNLEPEMVVKWTYKEAKQNVEEATEAQNFFKKALKLYESMLSINESNDTKLKESNLLIIHKNVEATGKLIDYLKGIEKELKKIGLAQR
jgi:tetratricopeptide (TPR) repeat protein